MKISRCLSLALVIVSLASARAERRSQELASGWKFIKGDAPLDAATAGWESVSIPHTWNAFDGQDGIRRHEPSASEAAKPPNPDASNRKSDYFRGICSYACTIDAPAEWKGRRVFLRFEAASIVAKAYLNGKLLGEHRGAFTAFCFELTPHLKPGSANELRVQVDNSYREDVPPISGDFNMDGGIYRPVHLIVTDPVCITPLDLASSGVYLTQKFLDDKKASVEVKTLLSNGGDASASVEIETKIADAAGKSVATETKTVAIPVGHDQDVLQTLEIAQPHRWNGRPDPYLYTVKVRVSRDGALIDEIVQPLGLRTVAITRDKGFLLNGQPYPIHGVNRHQDKRDQGWALSPADHDEDMRLILEVGATAVRLAHYPQSEYFHDLADRSGVLLWNEISLVENVRFTPEFKANAADQLREMIVQRGNHPSAAFWGLFNELRKEYGDTSPPLLEFLKSTAKELDPSRLIVGASMWSTRTEKFNQVPDFLGFNVYPGWYVGMPDDLTGMIDGLSAEMGGERIALSEYGAGSNPAQHQEGAPQKIEQRGQFHPEEWQSFVHEREWAQSKNNPKLWGTFIWVMFDFAVDNRNEGGNPGVNDKGLVTQDRKIKKDVFSFYKANWTSEPMVSIASRRMTPRNEALTEVKVYSNCADVNLKVNGKSIGASKPDEVCIARFPGVVLQPGKNHIEVIGHAQGKAVRDACEWVLVADEFAK